MKPPSCQLGNVLRRRAPAAVVWAAVGLCALPAAGQATPPATREVAPGGEGAQPLSSEEINGKIAELKQAEGIDPQIRDEAVGAYEKALGSLAQAGQSRTEARQYEQTAQEAPQRTAELEAEAAQPVEPDVRVPGSLRLEEMESRLKRLELDLGNLHQQREKLSEALKGRPARQEELSARLPEAEGQIEQVKKDLQALDGAEQPPAVKQARRAELRARREALEAEIASIRAALATFDTRTALLRAQAAAFGRRAALMEARVKAWQEAVNRKRKEQGLLLVERFDRAVEQAEDPLTRQVARENLELARLVTGPEGLNERRRRAKEALESARSRRQELQETLDTVRAMVRDVGLTNVLGMMLRQEQDRLPDLRRYQRRSRQRQEELSQVKLKVFELSRRKLDPGQIEARARELVASAEPPVAPERREDVIRSVTQALRERQDLLGELTRDYEEYRSTLTALDTAEKRLVGAGREFADFINQRVLWIRSAEPLAGDDLVWSWQALGWLLSPRGWRDVLAGLGRDAIESPALYALAALFLAGLLIARPWISGRIHAINEHVTRGYPGTIPATVWALLLVGLHAGTGPLIVWFAGWRLSAGPQATALGYAVGSGLKAAAALWFPLAAMRGICRPRGVGQTHFRWPRDALQGFGRSLGKLLALGVPLAFIVVAMEGQDAKLYRDSLGRIAAIAALLLLGVYAALVLRPHGVLIARTVARTGGWAYRFRYLWYPLAVVLPPALAIAAAAGYCYTTLQIAGRLLAQAYVILALVVLQAFLLRCVLIAQRRLALRAAGAEASQPAPSEAPSVEAGVRTEPQPLDLSAVNLQSRKLVRALLAGLLLLSVWIVWVDVVPALGIFRQVELWAVNGEAITLADLGLAVLVLVLTAIAARNIPGLLEITLLQRLRVEAGVRYAANALARYVILVVGIVLAIETIGVRWSHVQWLVAAITVGLGFGLQEIFANFVSGIIILFERPVRVGDTVTIGETSGTVSRIRMRATTITDWDRKELVVPNKEFVTGRLINWTLSDRLLRVILRVGIAYGSDTKLAERLLYEVARNHPLVLEDPKPIVMFTEFGDSTLNFELRVYIGGIEHYLKLWHEMNMAIDEAFRRHGVEIAFPQRDVHVRSIRASLPVQARVDRGQDADPRAVDPPGDL